MKKKISINWFRQDLRVIDNPSLDSLTKSNLPILNIFIFDEINCKEKKLGESSKVWLYHSLVNLDNLLDNKLHLYNGCAKEIIGELIKKYDVQKIVWNRCYEPWRIKRDIEIKSFLKINDIEVETFNGSLLWEPWEILKDDKTPYRVFTPYYRKGCLNFSEPRIPIKQPDTSLFFCESERKNINYLNLLPKKNWYKKLIKIWDISDGGVQNSIEYFFNHGISNYKEGRNFPQKRNVSRLSPFLRWGQISPNILWYNCEQLSSDKNVDHFKSELGWREFSYYLLYHFPILPKKNLQKKFDNFPWVQNTNFLNSWQKGKTGYPIVDAGMRELWETGYMHNRVRMIVGSFLVKNLLIDWKQGEEWFWDCLLDADLASNSASWQWVAGSGADAAPYFRIFNPVTQGQKFDKDGEYTKKFVPELKNLPSKYLFNPWETPKDILSDSGIELGKNYPLPIVDIKTSRNMALEAFSSIKVEKDK